MVAVVGAGLMGHWHAHYARQCGGAVSGVVDSDAVAAQRLARRIVGAHPFFEIAEMLEVCRPNVVHICTPLASHAHLARLAIEAGAHVLVEKPLAANAATCRELLEAAARHGLLLSPVHQFLFQRGFREALAAKASLGRILHLDATVCSAGGGDAEGDGLDDIAAEILPHALAIIERVMPGTLAAAKWHAIRSASGEWRASGAARDISLSILISMHGRPTENSMRIVAEGGVVELDFFHDFAMVDRAETSRASKIARPFRTSARRIGKAASNLLRRVCNRESAYPGLRALIAGFYAAIRAGSPNGPIGTDEILAVGEACDLLGGQFRRAKGTTVVQ